MGLNEGRGRLKVGFPDLPVGLLELEGWEMLGMLLGSLEALGGIAGAMFRPKRKKALLLKYKNRTTATKWTFRLIFSFSL